MPIVYAVGVSVNTHHGEQVRARVEQAVTDAILQCNAEGISTEERNSPIIRERMMAAHQRVLDEVEAEATTETEPLVPRGELIDRIANLEQLVQKLLEEKQH